MKSFRFPGNKRPEEKSIKTRIRFNGAARCRYKKQRQVKEQAEKTQDLSTAAGSKSDEQRGCAEVGTQKCTKSEHNTPSPSENCRGQKPKIFDRGSYIQPTKEIIRMILVPKDYLDSKLGDEVGTSSKLIRE